MFAFVGTFRQAWRKLFGSRRQWTPARLPIMGKYDAARRSEENRKLWQWADAQSAAASNSPDVRKVLRERSRYECGSSPYLSGMVQTKVFDLIGPGPRIKLTTTDPAINAAIETAFMAWAKAVCFGSKLRTMCSAKIRDGEGLGLFFENPAVRDMVKLDIRTFETDCLTEPGGTSLSDGIRYDALGNPVSYCILMEHPGDGGSSTSVTWWEAKHVLHWFRKIRPGQLRGVPEITPSLPLLATMRRYTAATLAAAEVAAMFAAVLESNGTPDQSAMEGKEFERLEIAKAMMTVLPFGYKAGQLKPEQPTTSFESFADKLLNEAARPLDMPLNIAACNSSKYNYASGRLDHQTYDRSNAVDRVEGEEQVCNRVFDVWLEYGRRVPDYLPNLDAITIPPPLWYWAPRRHINPLDDAKAAETRLKMHTTTLDREYADLGMDWREAMKQRAEELKVMEELGLMKDLNPETFGTPAGDAPPDDEQPKNDKGEPVEEEA